MTAASSPWATYEVPPPPPLPPPPPKCSAALAASAAAAAIVHAVDADVTHATPLNQCSPHRPGLTAHRPTACMHTLQILFLSGVGLTIGPQAALRFFVRPKNYKGSAFFLVGVALVVWGWTFVGALPPPRCMMCSQSFTRMHGLADTPGAAAAAAAAAGFGLEMWGFWLLFSAFFPTVLSFLRCAGSCERGLRGSCRRCFRGACQTFQSSSPSSLRLLLCPALPLPPVTHPPTSVQAHALFEKDARHARVQGSRQQNRPGGGGRTAGVAPCGACRPPPPALDVPRLPSVASSPWVHPRRDVARGGHFLPALREPSSPPPPSSACTCLVPVSACLPSCSPLHAAHPSPSLLS